MTSLQRRERLVKRIGIGALLLCSLVLNAILIKEVKPLLPYYQSYRDFRSWATINLFGRERPAEKLIYGGAEFVLHPSPRPTQIYVLDKIINAELPEVEADQLRSDVREAFGLDRIPRGPLRFQTHTSVSHAGYSLHEVSYQTQVGVRIPAYLLEPSEVASPWAAVLVIHGCGYGKAGPAGVIDDIHNSLAVHMARAGFLVLVPDRRGFGELQPFDHYVWPSCSGRPFDARALLEADAQAAFSTDLRSMDVFDLLVAVDYVSGRNDVTSVGLAGLSGGGVVATYVAGQNEDIDAIVLANGLPFRRNVSAPRADQRLGSTPKQFDSLPETPSDWLIRSAGEASPPLSIIADDPALVLLALLPPRPILLEFGERDPVSYVSGTNAAIGVVQQIYSRRGMPNQVSIVVEEGEHEFFTEPVIAFFQTHLDR